MRSISRLLPKALLVPCVISLVFCLSGCTSDELKPFYWDAGLTDEYIPPGKDPTGGQNPEEIEAGAQVFQNKYGSILIPADWIVGKDRSGVAVKNLANGAVFRSSENEDARMVSIKIYHNIVASSEGVSEWFDAFYTRKQIYTFGPDYTFDDKTYRSVSFDALVGGTGYKLEYMSPQNVLVEVNIYHATPSDPDIVFILDRIIVKDQGTS
jgi:hypothetical protein